MSTRPNVPLGVQNAPVRFVGGRGLPHDAGHLDQIERGFQVGEPMLFGGEWWLRVHVPGIGQLLVPLENLRPFDDEARIPT